MVGEAPGDREQLGADRGRAEAPPRPDPGAGRVGQGLREPRADDVRERHRGAQHRDRRRRGRRAGRRPRRMLGRGTERLLVVAEAYPELEALEELLQAAGRPARGRGPDRDHPPRLQRHGRDLQHPDPGLPGGDRRPPVRLRPARVLRRPGGGRGAPAGQPLPRPRHERASGAALVRARSPWRWPRCSPRPRSRRSADITDADVALRLAPDGSLLVTERLTFDYDGHFEGSYRDIILRHGERITDVAVSQDGSRFQPGGNTGLGSYDRPACSAPSSSATAYRIVWHYRATDEERTHRDLATG